MNTDNIILRGTDNPPLINKDDVLSIEEIDGNFIKIYNDFISLSQSNDLTLEYDVDRSYLVGEYATYNGRMWVATEISTGVTPIDGSTEWNDVFPTVLAHEKNKDTYLDYGGTNATSVAEIRAFIDAGLTSTTNLSLSTKTGTSFKIESSTGADVIIPQATSREAGLLNAEDKVKLDNIEGINTGDQTLASLSGEDVTNKVTDFTTINNTLYPTTQAVDTYLTSQVPSLVETFIDGSIEHNTNKATNFTTVNDTLYPSVKAVDDHINSKLAGLWDDRGSYDASTNLFPSTGGSGGSGAILKGDIWTINVQGTLGGTVMHVGDTVRALVDAPGQTSTNWALLENAIGYVPENIVNKATTFVGNTTSDTKYPTIKAVVDNFSSSNIKSILGVTVLSGMNTGDQDLSILLVKSNNLSDLTNTTTARTNLGLGSLATQSGTFSGTSSGTNTGDQDLSGLVVKNTAITGTTKTKITYDSKGLVTSGADATTADISDSLNKRYVTDANLTTIGNTSGTNTGDQIISDATITTSDITTNNVSITKHGFVPKAPNNTTQFLRGDGTWGTPASGGLTYFTEAQNTSSPNATVNVDSLTAVTGTTNGDFAIIPKGTGAFIVGHIPDGTSTNGGKRGAGAVEIRSAESMNYYSGASGVNSISIGKNTQSTQTGSVAIGLGCNSTGTGAIAMGNGNDVIASGSQSTAIQGSSNATNTLSFAIQGGSATGAGAFAGNYSTASGTNSLALAGTAYEGAIASSTNSVAIGKGTLSNAPYSISLGNWSSSKTIASKLSLGSFIDTAPYLVGSTQLGLSSSLANTITNTAIELSTQGGTSICLTLQNNEAIRVKGSIIGKQTTSTNVACYDFDCIVVRGTTAASTILPLNNLNLVLDTITLNTAPILSADTTNGGLSVKSGAKTTTTIKWSCRIDSTEVILA